MVPIKSTHPFVFWLAVWALCFAGLPLSAEANQLIASDPFTDGSRINTSGGDLTGLVYYMGQTSGTLAVTDDSAGIGSGNALG